MKNIGFIKKAICVASALCLSIMPLTACGGEDVESENRGSRVTADEWKEQIKALYNVENYTMTIKAKEYAQNESKCVSKVDLPNRVAHLKRYDGQESSETYVFRTENTYYYDDDKRPTVYENTGDKNATELYYWEINVTNDGDGACQADDKGLHILGSYVPEFGAYETKIFVLQNLLFPDNYKYWDSIYTFNGFGDYCEYLENEWNYDYGYSQAKFDSRDNSYIIKDGYGTYHLYFYNRMLSKYNFVHKKGYEQIKASFYNIGTTVVDVPSNVSATYEEFVTTHEPVGE